MAQYLWLGMGGDPEGGPDALRTAEGSTLKPGSVESMVQSMTLLHRSLESLPADAEARGLAYRRVGFDIVGPFAVSTVWLGIDTSDRVPPLIFETLVSSASEDLDPPISGDRYATEEQARDGHARILTALRAAQS